MKTHNKLVRDNIVHIIQSEGKQCFWKSLDDEDYRRHLKMKLLEESKELINARTHKNIREELADVYELILAIGKEYDISLDKINLERINKRLEKGGFEKKIFLIASST
ncbi:MAG: nucleoside triphosphate pyrophosphohydrolase [Planctomycetota bacterium]|jgi:predicted house-cleaning noncanonical NTP pyrophosphatase (MazG superfamily)